MSNVRSIRPVSVAISASPPAPSASSAERARASLIAPTSLGVAGQRLLGANGPAAPLAVETIDMLNLRASAGRSSEVSIIPRPNSMVKSVGEFLLNRNAVFVATGAAKAEAEKLAAALRPATRFPLEVRDGAPCNLPRIEMTLDASLAGELGDEGYKLKVTRTGITISAAAPAGLFYGGQSLKQLFPPSINGTAPSFETLSAPCVTITDRPRFSFRGALVDPARNFISVDELKKLIDGLAIHKLNRLHIHFTDDQGWRLAIEPTDEDLRQANERLRTALGLTAEELEKVKLTRKEFDNLTTIGSKRAETVYGRDGTLYNGKMKYDGIPHGGFYSRAQIAELVAYARERHVEIVPEVEMPGHTGAAIASNPILGNYPDRPRPVSTHWGVHEATLAPTERNIAFMQVVLGQVMRMFPDSKYIHIGGDEAPKKQWHETHQLEKKKDELRRAGRLEQVLREGPLDNDEHLQAYLVREMAKFIGANGRTLAGWDEILDAKVTLPKDKVAVWLWRDIKTGIEAAKAGHPVIMVPTDRTYIDSPPTDSLDEPIGQPGVRWLKDVFHWNRDPDPVPDHLTPEETKNIRGTIGAVWGEHTYDNHILQYFAWTRMPALAEAAWTDERLMKEPGAFEAFEKRMKVQEKRFDVLGLRYRRPEHPRERIRDLPPQKA